MTEYDPVLSQYLRLVKTAHMVTAQRFHQRIDHDFGLYAIHGHVIRDDDDEATKNDLASHIDSYHGGGTDG